MFDLQEKLHRAIELAAEYELLGTLAADEAKRAEARKQAAFHRGVAEGLRKELAEQRRFAAPTEKLQRELSNSLAPPALSRHAQ
jgi:anti-sigma-K factor RskA